MEKRHTNLQNFFEKVLQDSFIVELLSDKFGSMDLAAYNKKRRLSQVDHMQPVAEGNISNKLRLKLSPADSDMNLISGSTQGSNEDAESLQEFTLMVKNLKLEFPSNRNLANEAINLADPKEVSGNVQVEVASRHEVNDVFWEQFLT
ncbi:heat stress transcription factor-like protein [Medicago truncatula]|uniref:Heat stress transcription factor-like protein n=1 Tax=Medicago truncatula TaxID=3880 RepID=G7KJ08_MEDTR|nr:heat stress transcription factor-like protein [Medicago truncatula]